MEFKVIYICPTKDEIGRDSFYHFDSAYSYAQKLCELGYRGVSIEMISRLQISLPRSHDNRRTGDNA